MRELRRLLLEPDRLGFAAEQAPRPASGAGAGDQDSRLVRLRPEESHYLARVLRMRQGDRLAIGDGEGRLWSAVIEVSDCLRVEQPLEQVPPPCPALTLAMAVPRRDPEIVWRMATELGVAHLQPLIAARSVVRGQAPLERWRSIVREACEQSERLWLPSLGQPVAAMEWFRLQRDRAARQRCFLATTRQEELTPLSELISERREGREPEGLSVAIGPEGGWSPEEEALAVESGWRLVSLGQGILRSSTAAVSAVALLALGGAHLRT